MALIRLLEFIVVRVVLAVLQALPYPVALRVGTVLGRLLFQVAWSSRARARSNLEAAFPSLAASKQLNEISRGVFETLGRHAAEFAHMIRRRRQGFTILNADILSSAHRQSKGVILVSAHLGCFSRLALVPGMLEIPASAIMKKQSNNRLHQWVIGLMRSHFQVDVLLKSDAADLVGQELQRGRMVGFFADQRPRHGGVEGVFFGRHVRIPTGPAVYARRYGSPIVVLTLANLPDGSHVARCEGPVSAEGSLEDVSRRWLAILEDRILDHPEQWMWMHRRWK